MTNATSEGGRILLSEWELANLHLPPVTTVTFYPGAAPVAFLEERVAEILGKNPWLGGRLVKKCTPDGVLGLSYSKGAEPAQLAKRHFSVLARDETCLTLDMNYERLVRTIAPIQAPRSKPATDKDQPLFKVTVVPVEGDAIASGDLPLQSQVTLPAFALVVSMNHTLGDGHTYYRLYGMLDADAEVEALEPTRVPGFEAAKVGVIGKPESAMLTSAGFGLGIVGTYLIGKWTRRPAQNICVHSLDPDWVSGEKARAKEEGKAPFISTNDALSSWFFREMKCDVNLMLVNLRNREPSILGLGDTHAGNYEANVPYFPGDVESASLIRQSIRDPDGGFRARRAGSPQTPILSFGTLLKNRAAIITNWAGFYEDVHFKADESSGDAQRQSPQLHLPIMEPDGMITSVWQSGVVFCPREGEVALLMITRRFDSAELLRQKSESGSAAPMGTPLI